MNRTARLKELVEKYGGSFNERNLLDTALSIKIQGFFGKDNQKQGQPTGLYKSWQAMLYRCEDPSCVDFCRYGGKGITVCDEWHSFSAFVRDMGASWRPGLTIDRIDNNKGYYKGNCEWLDRSEHTRKTWRDRKRISVEKLLEKL